MLPGASSVLSGGLGGSVIIPPYGLGTDPNFASVVLLMGFQGSNNDTGSPAMDDESLSAHGTLSGSTSTKISTAVIKFGRSSVHFNGDYKSFSDSADWNLSSGSFTIEMFIYLTSVSGVQFLIGQWEAAPNLGWELYMNGNKLSWNVSTTGSDNNFDIAGATSITTSAWHHVAIDYNGTKYRTYVDGVMDGSFSTPRTIHDSNLNLALGASQNGSFIINSAYMNELRITKGVARYASDGGLTVPTAEFPRS